MVNIAAVLKQEILRLAGKAVRAAVTPMKKEKVALKKAVRALRKQVRKLEEDTRILMAQQERHGKLVVGAIPGDKLSIRITAKGMRSLRRKLGLTQAEFAKLIGVTQQTIWLWEKKDGALRVRQETKKAIYAIRGIGAREAKRRVQDMAKPATRRRGPRSKARK